MKRKMTTAMGAEAVMDTIDHRLHCYMAQQCFRAIFTRT